MTFHPNLCAPVYTKYQISKNEMKATLINTKCTCLNLQLQATSTSALLLLYIVHVLKKQSSDVKYRGIREARAYVTECERETRQDVLSSTSSNMSQTAERGKDVFFFAHMWVGTCILGWLVGCLFIP